MKREINVLSPEAIARRRDAMIIRRERALARGVFLSLGILLFSYGGIWWVFSSFERSLSDQIVFQSQDQAESERDIQFLNKEIDMLDSRIASYTLWTTRMSDVFAAVPSGISITKFELKESPETLVITGSASQGSDAVAYQAALEALPWVDRVVAPLQNFARFPTATVVFTVFQKLPDSKAPSL